MEKKIRVAPSLLAADFLNLKKEMQRILLSKADWVHLAYLMYLVVTLFEKYYRKRR